MPTTSHGFRYPASSDAPNVPQYIQNLASDVNGFVNSLQRVAPTGLGLTSSFENWGFGYRNLCYWREGRTVYVAGCVRLLTSTAPTAVRTLATLPAGFRPAGTVVADGVSTARTQVLADGRVQLENATFNVTLGNGVMIPVNLVVPLG